MSVTQLYSGIGNENFESTGYQTAKPSVSFGNDKYAQKNRAWLARENWADYQARFQPKEDELIDAVTGTELLDERLGKIKINNDKAFMASADNANQYRMRYGIQQSDAQKTQDQNNRSMAMAGANASAMNQTRTHIKDRNMAVIGGGEARQMATAI